MFIHILFMFLNSDNSVYVYLSYGFIYQNVFLFYFYSFLKFICYFWLLFIFVAVAGFL